MGIIEMVDFEKNLNCFGVNEPLLYPIQRPDGEPITIAEYLYLFFEFAECQILVTELRDEETYEVKNLVENWQTDIETNYYIISSNEGEKFPRASKSLPNGHQNYRKVHDPEGVKGLKSFFHRFGNIVNLQEVIGCGGEGVVIHKRNEELVFKFVKCQCDEKCDSNYEKSSIYNEKMLKCNEFRVATHHGLGPYRQFGLSRIFGTWNYVIGDNQNS